MAITSNRDAKPQTHQHSAPCHDCPWRRASLPGWLGGPSVAEWLARAHSDAVIECHTVTSGHECAGAAVYRANVCKKLRDPEAFRLKADHKLVFSTPFEFEKHHAEKPKRRPSSNNPVREMNPTISQDPQAYSGEGLLDID